MVETAAHLVDELFPQVPVRQWVLSFPKRLRYFLSRDSNLLNCVLRIFLDSVEKALRSGCPDAPDDARSGAVTLRRAIRGTPPCMFNFHKKSIKFVVVVDPVGNSVVVIYQNISPADFRNISGSVGADFSDYLV